MLSGALYALALPPAAVDALGWIALTPLFVALGSVRPARAFGLGVTWFFVASIGFASPLPNLIGAYFATPWVVGAAAFVGLTLVFGPIYGAYAAWTSWLTGRGAASALLAAAGWGLAEWARTGTGSIFGWALLAHTQTPGALVLQIADLGGSYLPGMLLAATAYALASLLAPPPPGSRRWGQAVAVAVVALAALAYGALRVTRAPPAGEAVRVAVVQGGVPHEERWRPDLAAVHLERYVELTRGTAAHHPALVVWPEYAVAFDVRRRSRERAALFAAAARDGPELLFGAPYHRGLLPSVLHNSAFLLRDGGLAGRYDKNELLPFAERNPWPGLLSMDRQPFTPGGRARPISTRDAEVGVFLCSEGLRPDVARRLTAAGATLLAHLSNDSWLGSESAARIQLRAAALRAVENRRYLVRATGSGRSAVIDAAGRVLVASRFGRPDVLFAAVEPMADETPYTRFGDVAVLLAGAAALLGSARAVRRTTGATPVHGRRRPEFTAGGD